MTQQKLKIGDVVETVDGLSATGYGKTVDVPAGTRLKVTRLLRSGGIQAVPEDASEHWTFTLMSGMYRPVRSTISE